MGVTVPTDDVPLYPGAFLSRLSPSERRLIKQAGWTALFVEGYGNPVPRSFGDNQGVWPARVRSTGGDPRQRARDADYDNPIHGVYVHSIYWLRWPVEAERVTARITTLLAERREPLAHAWHNITPAQLDELIRWALTVEGVAWHDDNTIANWAVEALKQEAARRVRARF